MECGDEAVSNSAIQRRTYSVARDGEYGTIGNNSGSRSLPVTGDAGGAGEEMRETEREMGL